MALQTQFDPAQRFSLVQSHRIYQYHSRLEQTMILSPVAHLYTPQHAAFSSSTQRHTGRSNRTENTNSQGIDIHKRTEAVTFWRRQWRLSGWIKCPSRFDAQTFIRVPPAERRA